MIALLPTLVIVWSLSYTAALFVLSRRRRRGVRIGGDDDLFFVVVIPCLNEEVVIGASLDRLLAVPSSRFAVLVVDDGSDDRTAEIVRSYDPDRVWLLQRRAPEARKGKGEALNHAFRVLRDGDLLGGRSHDDVVVLILDADGRIEPNALFEVAPYFVDPQAGAVQIGVRMYNADESMLARMQDLEFVTFTEIFQRARQRVGSVGLGGNGQFTRLSALESLGDAPWTDCLTEDLDLGIRLLVAGWHNNYCPTAHVKQQAVTSVRRLVRQRSRWFQGHLQCWKRVPLVLRSSLSGRAVFDLTYHLLSPALVLAMSLPVVLFVLTLVLVTISQVATGPGDLVDSDTGLVVVVWYLLTFGLAPFYGFVYWLAERNTSLVRSLGYAHVYTLYSYLWFPAGWLAVGRILRRRRGWAKTARTPEAPVTR